VKAKEKHKTSYSGDYRFCTHLSAVLFL